MHIGYIDEARLVLACLLSLRRDLSASAADQTTLKLGGVAEDYHGTIIVTSRF